MNDFIREEYGFSNAKSKRIKFGHERWFTCDDLNVPLRPSDNHPFSEPVGTIGPYYTIKLDIWVNSLRNGKSYILRFGNSSIHEKANKNDCGHEMPSISIRWNAENNLRVLSIYFDCNDFEEIRMVLRKTVQ